MVVLSQCQQSSWPRVLNLKALLKYWSRLLVRYLLEIVTNVCSEKNLVIIRLDRKCCHNSVGAAQLSHSIPNRDQICLCVLVEYYLFFSLFNHFHSRATSQAFLYSIIIAMAKVQMSLLLSFHQFRPLQRGNATLHLRISIPFIPSIFQSSTLTALSKKVSVLRIDSDNDLSLNATSLTPSCQETFVTLNPYFHNLHFLPPPLISISHTPFSNTQYWMSLEPCPGLRLEKRGYWMISQLKAKRDTRLSEHFAFVSWLPKQNNFTQ